MRVRAILIGLLLMLPASWGEAQTLVLDTHKDCGAAISTNTQTCSYTMGSSANGILCVGALINSGDNLTGLTWAGSSMNFVTKVLSGFGGEQYLYCTTAPATGTNNIVLTQSGTSNMSLVAISWTSAAQSGNPEVTTTATSTTSPISATLSTLTANASVFGWASCDNCATFDGLSGSMIHNYSGTGTYAALGDTGAIASPQSVTAGFTTTGAGGNLTIILASVKAFGAGSSCSSRSLMGVGC